MSRPIIRWAALIQIGLILFTGCHPTQPFFVPRDESLANYMAQSMDIEYADVHVDSLPEVTMARVPLGPDHIPTEFTDLTLEDCISMALQNSKILRVIGGSNTQSGSVAAALLSAQPGQMPSIYDPAIISTTASTQPLAIDNQGNRIAPRGSIRSNQVGGVEDALSEFDTQLSMVGGYNTTDRPRNVGPGNVFNPQFFQAVDANAQAALSKRMVTGTIATLRATSVYSRNNILSPGLGRNVPSDYTTALEAQVTQPLLRGRGTLVNRVPIMLARMNEDIALHDFEANIRNLVKSVEDAYWDLYCGYRALEAAQIAQSSALDLWRVAEARTKLGDTPPEQEAQARAQYAQFTAQVHTSLYGSTVPGNDPRGLYGREQILREKIGWSATDGRMLRPSDEPTVARIQFDWHEVHAEALTRNTELRRQKWAIKQRELELLPAKNQMLAQLDATGFIRWVGVGDDFAAADRSGARFPSPGSNSIQELTSGDYQEFGARLEFTPQAFGKRRALANIQNAQILIKKSQEELLTKEEALVQELSFAWRNLDSTFISMKDFLDQWQANEDEIKIYNDKIAEDTGELNQLLDFLLRAEERRSRAQLQYYQAVCEYNKSIVNIHYLKGSLLDLNSVSLEEGAWVDKAYWDANERSRERASGIYFDYGYTRPGVVSNGPVESGGLTEGNVSIPGSRFAPETTPQSLNDAAEEIQPEEFDMDGDSDDDSRELQPLPERAAPTASNRPNMLRNNTQAAKPQAPSNVRQASAATSAERFEWGDLGISSGRNGSQRSISDSDQATSPASTGSGVVSEASPWRSR